MISARLPITREMLTPAGDAPLWTELPLLIALGHTCQRGIGPCRCRISFKLRDGRYRLETTLFTFGIDESQGRKVIFCKVNAAIYNR
jgi:hypothetical protein